MRRTSRALVRGGWGQRLRYSESYSDLHLGLSRGAWAGRWERFLHFSGFRLCEQCIHSVLNS